LGRQAGGEAAGEQRKDEYGFDHDGKVAPRFGTKRATPSLRRAAPRSICHARIHGNFTLAAHEREKRDRLVT
jgi:hypothetical protein